MVRGNWQKRVETAEARRQEQRARKARKGDRETYRVMASGLMSYLVGTDSDALGSLHVWLDSTPKKSFRSGGGKRGNVPEDCFESDDDDDGGCRGRKKKKQGARHQQQGPAKKKAHPRQGLKHSHADQHDNDDEAHDDILLCSKHFFFNKCAGAAAVGGGGKGKNRGSKTAGAVCKLHHSQEPTIAFIMKKARGADADIVAASADAASQSSGTDAATSASASSEDGAMNMLWYLPTAIQEKDEIASESRPINEALQTCLSRNKVGAASIVYVVWGRRLIYDRNRGGILDEATTASSEVDGDSPELPVGDDGIDRKQGRRHGRSRGESMAERDESGQYNDGGNILLTFPGSVLEAILTYLPDLYTGNLPLVCKSWYSEIGKSSPNLWRQLLLRRGFPLPANIGPSNEDIAADTLTADQPSPRDVCRDAFIGHYEACRDLEAIRELFSGLQHRQSQQRESLAPNEAAMINYGSYPGSPVDTSGRRVGIKVWGDGKVIVAYEDDCTVRLFETVSTGGSLACRQTVCVIISPEPKSKRGRWFLGGMDLDDNYVCCVCRPDTVFEGEMGALGIRSPYLHVVKREDILCASGGGNRAIRPIELDEDDIISINLREELIDFLSTEIYIAAIDDDHDADLIDYIENEEPNLLGLDVSPDIVACGGGKFLFMIRFIALDVDEGTQDDLAYRIFLYSVSERRFTWSVNAGAAFQTRVSATPRMSVALGCRRPPSFPTHRVLLTSFDTPLILHIEITKDGRVEYHGVPYVGSKQADTIHAALEQEVRRWNELRQENEPLMDTAYRVRPAAFMLSEVVVAHNIHIFDHRARVRAVLTFSSIDSDGASNRADLIPKSVLTLQGDCRVYDMHVMYSKHIILLCQTYAIEAGGGDNQEVGGTVGDDDGICIILVHVPSRTEIGRYRLMDSPLVLPPNLKIAASKNIVVLESMEGLIMSGRGVRKHSIGKNDERKADEKTKKKKKRQANRASGHNKDGFARGMSLRG